MRFRFIVTLLCVGTILTGCNKEAATKETTLKNLESYSEANEVSEEDSSPYEYLTSATLGDENYAVSIYLPDTDNLKVDDYTASASTDGITTTAYLFEETDEASSEDVLQKKFEEEKGRIGNLKGMEDLNVSDLIEGDDYQLIEMDYTLNGSCISILKMDDLKDGFYLLSYINVDASSLTENSEAILKEILEVYGVNLGI